MVMKNPPKPEKLPEALSVADLLKQNSHHAEDSASVHIRGRDRRNRLKDHFIISPSPGIQERNGTEEARILVHGKKLKLE